MKRRRVLTAMAGMTAVLLSLIVCWSAAYLITALVFGWIGRKPDDLVVQVGNSLFGFLLFGGMAVVASLITQVRQKQTALVQALNDALHRIGQGDFTVNVALNRMVDDHPFGELASSINHMAVELNQMEQMRQEFIATVSHDIQSPLTSISGFARALQDDGLSRDERLHYLGVIEMESMRLSRLSENLLKLTSLESEHPPMELKRYRLDRQLRNVILSLEPQWMEKSLEMDIALAEVSICADEDLMSQVWANLCSNSIKFTPDGGTISICLEERASEVIVCIADTGIGIATEDQARIFERFYRADRSRNRDSGGSGLGLAIVKRITDLHDGTIQVESARGKGTSLTLRFPAGL